jgi:predicted ATPase/class 3 adenylate cyclase
MAAALPTGLVSFLLTDVEGSTRLWERDRRGMAASLALHDEIMRSAVAARGGHVFSTAGDAFAVAFGSAAGAVSAAVDIQRALGAAQWPGPLLRVRIGIHTGDAEERDGDYFGPALNRAARIMSAGHGGQILLSSVTASECGGEVSLRDLGTHRLKDLEEPERVFEVRHPDLPRIDRPIRTLDVRRHNLPDYLTSFVGRDGQIERLDAELSSHRLVVLTGVGGTGKTRLAVEALRRRIEAFPDGAWLIELAPVGNPDLIVTVIGETWGLRPGEGATIEDVVTRYLWSRDLVLVVDNCEHVLDGAAAAVKLILDACPHVRIVATSRESLGIPGEATVPVPSLGLPEPDAPAESEAVRLFLDRARGVRPGFRPSDGDLAAITRICRRIDGIPLGLELAAARLRSLSPAELAARLDDSFRILSRSAKTALPRQRTLQATIDWSHDLLTPPERVLFRRLAMFLGGFDLAAAEAVCSGDGVEDREVVDLLDSLVDKSLVVPAHQPSGTTRFRLLEPIRQYAQERLAAEGESEAIAAAHAEHYAAFVAEAAPHTRGPDQMAWERRLDLEYDNIRGAFESMLESGRVERYLETGFHLFLYWMHLGMHLEGIETLLAGIDAAAEDADVGTLLKAWFCVVGLGAEITDPKAIDHGRRMVEVARSTGDPNAIGRAEMQLGAAIRHSTTDPEYLEHLEEGRRLLDAHPEPSWWEPAWEKALLNLIFAAYFPAEDPRLREHVDTALELFEQVGDRALLAAALGDSGGLWGRADEAWLMGNMRRSVEILAELEVPYWYGHALMGLGAFLNAREEYEEAAAHLATAAPHLADCGDVNCWASSSRGLAHAEGELGRPRQAAGRIAAVIDQLPILPMAEVHVPRTLDQAARVLQLGGRFDEAAVVFGKALATEFPAESVFPRDELHGRIRSALEERFDPAELERLMEEGGACDSDEVLRRARTWLEDLAASDPKGRAAVTQRW